MGRGSLVPYFMVLLVAGVIQMVICLFKMDIFWNGCLDNQKLNINLLYYNQLKGQRFNALSQGRLSKDQSFLVENQLRLFALICSAPLIYVSNFLLVSVTIAIQCLNIVFRDFGNIIFLFQHCFGFSISFAFPYLSQNQFIHVFKKILLGFLLTIALNLQTHLRSIIIYIILSLPIPDYITFLNLSFLFSFIIVLQFLLNRSYKYFIRFIPTCFTFLKTILNNILISVYNCELLEYVNTIVIFKQ